MSAKGLAAAFEVWKWLQTLPRRAQLGQLQNVSVADAVRLLSYIIGSAAEELPLLRQRSKDTAHRFGAESRRSGRIPASCISQVFKIMLDVVGIVNVFVFRPSGPLAFQVINEVAKADVTQADVDRLVNENAGPAPTAPMALACSSSSQPSSSGAGVVEVKEHSEMPIVSHENLSLLAAPIDEVERQRYSDHTDDELVEVND